VSLCGVDLFARRLNVDVDLLCSSTSKYASSKHKQSHQNNEHKNHYDGDHADTAAATAFFSHDGSSLIEWEYKQGANWREEEF
jgi:hypothetical protein